MIQNYKYYTGLLGDAQQLTSISTYMKNIGVIDTFNNSTIINKDKQIIISLIKYLKQIDANLTTNQQLGLFYDTFITNCKANGITNFSIQYKQQFVLKQLKRIYKAAYSIALQSKGSTESFFAKIKNNEYLPMAIPNMNMSTNIKKNLSLLFSKCNKNQLLVLPISVEIAMNGLTGFKWGNIFTVQQIPTYIKDNIYFQVSSIKNIINIRQ